MRSTVRVADVEAVRGARALLGSHLAVRIHRALRLEDCARWTAGVLGARGEWTRDFGGDQFSLGRAFYTHLESDLTELYFDDAAASDARVERHAPGLQGTLRALLSDALGAHVAPRPDWCGAGVHVFPADGPVAAKGGVVHFDTEGLADDHIRRRAGAVSLVAMLQPAVHGGSLRVWPVLFSGSHEVDDITPGAGGDEVVPYEAGDAVLFDSYRLHQIQPFSGARDRISATLHGAELNEGLWECWF